MLNAGGYYKSGRKSYPNQPASACRGSQAEHRRCREAASGKIWLAYLTVGEQLPSRAHAAFEQPAQRCAERLGFLMAHEEPGNGRDGQAMLLHGVVQGDILSLA